MEQFFIKENKSYGKHGYNMTFGGEGVKAPMSEETKLKMSIKKKELFAKGKIKSWNKGLKTSEETKQKQSKAKKGKTFKNSGQFKTGSTPWCKGIKINIKHDKQFKKGSIPYNKGISMSEEQKKLLSEVKKGKMKANSGSFKKGGIPWNKGLKKTNLNLYENQ